MAAQWWEIAIPVAGTISSGVLGGWLGARWQWRNSDRLLTRQFEEAQRAREAAAQEATRGRAEQLANDRALRVSDEKRKTYVRYLRVLDDYKDVKAEAVAAGVDDLDVGDLLAQAQADPSKADELRRKATEVGEFAKRRQELSDRLVEQTYEMLFIASDEVGMLGIKLGELVREGDDAAISKCWSEFLSKARKELAV